MKILFLLRHSGYVRNFDPVVRALTAKGHQVYLLFSRIYPLHDEAKLKVLMDRSPGASYSVHKKMDTVWAELALRLRRLQNYLRYLEAPYRNSLKLRARAAKRIPTPIKSLCDRFLEGRSGRIWKVIAFLRKIEKAVPVSGALKEALCSYHPDVFLVTPLVDLDGYQLDWVKAAKAKGIPSGLCVASWDNLTNKGLLQVEPDRVIVWNEAQKRELAELHRIGNDRVTVTGAQCYDEWFSACPSRTRDVFSQRTGVRAGAPYILYLCSSPFICPNEVEWVERWLNSMQSDPSLAQTHVLIRPHPQNAEQWKGWRFERVPGQVSVYPREGANPIDKETKEDYYDSLFYSSAVVGVNTSGLIEAGILGKPVFTVLSRKMAQTQTGTLHFRYLTDNGLLHVSADLEHHFRALGGALKGEDVQADKRRRFIEFFVRPRGMERTATSFMVEAIEELSSLKPQPVGDGRCVRTARVLLWPEAALISWVFSKKKKFGKSKAAQG